MSSSNLYHYVNSHFQVSLEKGIGTHLILETRVIGVMPRINLSFMIDHGEEVILIHHLWSRAPMYTSCENGFGCYETRAYIYLASFALPPSMSFITSVVYGAMLIEAGNRTCASIFRADDLSLVLCSNRYARAVRVDCELNERVGTLNWKLNTGGRVRILRRLLVSYFPPVRALKEWVEGVLT